LRAESISDRQASKFRLRAARRECYRRGL